MPRWRTADISRALAVSTLPDDLQATLDCGEWSAAQRQLIAWLQARPSRFVLNRPAAEVRESVLARWPEAADEAVKRATKIVEGRFDLLGYHDLEFSEVGGEIDWHRDPVHGRRVPMAFWSRVPYLDPAWGDHKVIWELNRQQHWFALSRALWLTGDHFYAREMVRDLSSWLAANPPLMGANWASMLELGFRSLSWVWGLHAMLAVEASAEAGEGPWLLDLFVALDRQLTHVEQNLSRYFSPNTHLTGEALALYVVGTALPELAGSTRWTDSGRRVLLQEIDRQIERDGGHVERSTHYHRYTLDFYLLALLTARRSGDLDAEWRFTEAVERLAPFALAMADASGTLPRIGDDDAGRLWPITGRDSADVRDSLAIAATVLNRPEWAPWGLTEEVIWLAGGSELRDRRLVRGERSTATFPQTGYVTSRTADGDHLVVDVGPHGYLNGGHAHADALAVTLSLRGKPLLVDPGTPTYTMNAALRDHLRSSASHNTLTLDGTSSAIPSGPFHWRTRTDSRLALARGNPRFVVIEGAHDGYPDVTHRRIAFAGPRGYLFVDQVSGAGEHEAAVHWHFDPRWRLTCESEQCLRAVDESGALAWLVHDTGALWLVNADEESQLGYVSPAYGMRMPAWTARLTHREPAPFSMVTWIAAGRDHVVPRIQRMPAQGDAGGDAVAVRIGLGLEEWVTLVRPGAAAELRNCAVAEYHTNARALHYAVTAGRLTSLSAIDVTHALALREGLISLEAEQPIADLHVARHGGRLELWATTPPNELRLQGAVVVGATTIVLNGRELLRKPTDRRDTVAIAATEWTEARPWPFERRVGRASRGDPATHVEAGPAGVASGLEPEQSTEHLEA
jgi:hypothetical protein